MQYALRFEQIYLSKATHWEKDGSSAPMTPNDARLRNLTYAAPLYVDVVKKVTRDGYVDEKKFEKKFIGKIPIMLRYYVYTF